TLASGAVVSPYIAEFNSFSSELAAALEGFYKSPNGLLVKAVEVKPIEEKEKQAPGLQPNPAVPGPNPTAPTATGLTNPPPRRFPQTPGAPGTPGLIPPPRQRFTPGPAGGGAPPGAGEVLKTVLDEKMLSITLWIDLLK